MSGRDVARHVHDSPLILSLSKEMSGWPQPGQGCLSVIAAPYRAGYGAGSSRKPGAQTARAYASTRSRARWKYSPKDRFAWKPSTQGHHTHVDCRV